MSCFMQRLSIFLRNYSFTNFQRFSRPYYSLFSFPYTFSIRMQCSCLCCSNSFSRSNRSTVHSCMKFNVSLYLSLFPSFTPCSVSPLLLEASLTSLDANFIQIQRLLTAAQEYQRVSSLRRRRVESSLDSAWSGQKRRDSLLKLLAFSSWLVLKYQMERLQEASKLGNSRWLFSAQLMAESIWPFLASMTARLLSVSQLSGRWLREILKAQMASYNSPKMVQMQPMLYHTSLQMRGSSRPCRMARSKQLQQRWYWWLVKQQRPMLFHISVDQQPSSINLWYSLREIQGWSLQKQQDAMLATASMLQFSIISAFLQYSWDLSRFCSWSQMRPVAISSLGSQGCRVLAWSMMPSARSTLSCFSQILLRQRKDSMLLLCFTEESNCFSDSLRKLRWQQHFPRASFHQGSSQLLSSVAQPASQRHFCRLCSTQKRYWKMRRDLDLRCAILRRSALELSKKFSPYCVSEAVERRRMRPLEVVGTPPLVIILPVLSIPLERVPARDAALVPTRWKPVLSRPLLLGRMMGLACALDLKEVPTLANLLAYSSLIIISAIPSSQVYSQSTQFSLMRH